MKQINIGILGTSEIAPRSFIEPSRKLEEINVFGIASREKNKAKLYAEKHSIPNYFSSYDELLQCNEIDAVYIPLISSLHAEYTIKAIVAKKNVLVEKPICFTSQDIADIESALRGSDIFVLEGLMSQHHPWLDKLQEIIKKKTYGDIKSIRTKACYNIDNPNDFRLFPEKGGSVFYEEGLLWSHLTQVCFGLKPSRKMGYSKFDGPYGGDNKFKCRLEYPNGCISDLFCSYSDPYEANHWIEFEEAILSIRNFWRPTFGFVRMKFDIEIKGTCEKEKVSFEPQNYYYNQLQYFLNAIKNKNNNTFLFESFERIKLMEVIFENAKKSLANTAQQTDFIDKF